MCEDSGLTDSNKSRYPEEACCFGAMSSLSKGESAGNWRLIVHEFVDLEKDSTPKLKISKRQTFET
jgi:hypothetical protein